MAGADILSFGNATRSARSADPTPAMLTDAALRARQASVPLDDCHVALHRVSYEIAAGSNRFNVFHNLSAVFPKGRRIVLLGHKGAGKTVLLDLMLRERAPSRGEILGTSRLSWPIHATMFLEPKLSIRQNVIFLSRVLGVDAKTLLGAVQGFCELSHKQLDERSRTLAIPLRRRIGIIALIAADFDCHIIDAGLKGAQFGLEGAQADWVESVILGRDYVFAITNVKQLPANADLAYILYDGRLYFFDDIGEAVAIFEALPVPADPGGRRKREDSDEEGEPVIEEGL